MSDDTQKRDLTAADDIHPMAKVLFGWTTKPRAGAFVFWGLALLSLALIVVDLWSDRHPHNEVESYLGFYGIYGFVSFAFVVLIGWPLGRLLRRSENYYGDQDDEDDS